MDWIQPVVRSVNQVTVPERAGPSGSSAFPPSGLSGRIQVLGYALLVQSSEFERHGPEVAFRETAVGIRTAPRLLRRLMAPNALSTNDRVQNREKAISGLRSYS